MTTNDTVLRQLTELDPARDLAPPTPAQAAHLRARIPTHAEDLPAPAPLHRPRRRLALASAAAAVVLGVLSTAVLPGIISGTGTTATAAAIPMLEYAVPAGVDAAAELEQLADHVRETAPPDPAPGPYTYTHYRESTWASEDRGDGVIERHPREVERWTWVAADGTSRTLDKTDGVTGTYQDWPAEGHGTAADLSGTPEQVVRRIAGAEPEERDGWELIGTYQSDVSRYGQFSAKDRAAFFEALATTDVTSYGNVTDRAGRKGIAFGSSFQHDGLVDEYRIIVDPDTGAVLGSEDVITGLKDASGEDEVVKSYLVILESGYADGLPECGDIGCRSMGLPG
ncbi:hypothetical protein ATJ97_2450 [Georgenia soli]|uniref:CU044_5270 family protein n=1 Tax=Georgenia soli TaxID=638953 RepID=A0A2A9ENW0_9MICO|nr:CU044_5270 family protein [Georgenia soli]PFG39930.1 hypothetical protein ATJ97_2450 [Georgenia soli]